MNCPFKSQKNNAFFIVQRRSGAYSSTVLGDSPGGESAPVAAAARGTFRRALRSVWGQMGETGGETSQPLFHGESGDAGPTASEAHRDVHGLAEKVVHAAPEAAKAEGGRAPRAAASGPDRHRAAGRSHETRPSALPRAPPPAHHSFLSSAEACAVTAMMCTRPASGVAELEMPAAAASRSASISRHRRVASIPSITGTARGGRGDKVWR